MTERSPTFATLVIRRDKRCQECGTTDSLQAHHVVPVSAGGSDTIGNGEALCPGHHADKHPDVPRALFFSDARGKTVRGKHNATTLAALIGCSVRTVTRTAKRLGIKRQGNRWAFSGNELARMKAAIGGKRSEAGEQMTKLSFDLSADDMRKLEALRIKIGHRTKAGIIRELIRNAHL